MAPRRQQHTFTTVPNPLGMQGLMARPTDGPQSKPPMTSKQAQKLYREATRGPRLSRAEQRRVEREEQDRIRRELDRDRQAGRARALRDRKRAKDQRALDEKRRMGLPLVDPRASQDTISRFVRGNGAGRKRDAAGGLVGLSAVREEVGEDSRSAAEGGVNENTLPGQAAGTSEGKKPRLGHGLEDGDGDTEKAAEIKGMEVPAKGLEHSAGKDLIADEKKPALSGSASLEKMVDKGITLGEGEGDLVPKKEPLEIPKPEETKGLAAKTTLGRTTSMDDTKPDSGQNKPGNMARPEVSKAAAEAVPMKALTKPSVSRPSKLGTPDQTTSGREKAMIKTTPDPPPNKTPLNKSVQTPDLQPHAARPPQQQRPPKPAAVQPPSAREVLQEITNTPNRLGPLSGSDSASKFAVPYKPSRVTPQRQSPAAVPAFKQPIPRTPAAGGQKPQFLPRNSATCSRPTTRSRPVKPLPKSRDDFYSAPPTSTQLFVMSHIDDLCPSPTQEARELQGDPPAAVQPVKPGPREQPHIPSFKGDRPRQPTRQATRAHAPMAPPPRPKMAEPAGGKPVTVEQATTTKPTTTKPSETLPIPFICTQDLLFSSQDLRDVEESTTTPSKTGVTMGSNKPPPFKRRSAVAQRPSPLSGHTPRTPAQPHMTSLPQPKPWTVGAKQLPTPDNDDRSSQPMCRQKSDCLESNYQLANEKSRHNNGSGTPHCPTTLAAKDTLPTDAQPRPPSPEKPRFLGSSAEVELALALHRSKKSHEEEERRRQQEEQRRRHEEERRRHHEEEERRRQSGRRPPQNLTREGPVKPIDTASQETDYGDPELDSIDFEDLVTATS